MNWEKAVITFAKCVVVSLIFQLIVSTISNGFTGDTDLYGFPNTWKFHTKWVGWRYDYGVLIRDIFDVPVFFYLITLFIEVSSRLEKRKDSPI